MAKAGGPTKGVIETPVIMPTARGQVTDKVVGLKRGADDYVTKLFEMMELLARIEAKLRRAPAHLRRRCIHDHELGCAVSNIFASSVLRFSRPKASPWDHRMQRDCVRR